MWAIFIALFGIIFWAFKIGADRSSSREADRRLAQHKNNWDDWYAAVKDYDLEKRIEAEFDAGAYNTMADSALQFIRTLPGLEYADFDYRSRKNSSYYIRSLILYIEMVKRGKLESAHITELGNYIELALDLRPSKAARIAFGKWVENTLQEHGVTNARLYYTGKDYASFEWEPFVYDHSKAYRITEPDLESKMMGSSSEQTDYENSLIVQRKKHFTNK